MATHNAKILTSIAKYTAANANHITHVVYMEKPINFASINTKTKDNYTRTIFVEVIVSLPLKFSGKFRVLI